MSHASVLHARPARRARRAAGGSLRAVWLLARVGLIAAALAVAVAWRAYGYVPLAVQTGSMAPTLPPHSLLFVEEVPADRVRVGDVITFDPPGAVPRTTHRVVQRAKLDGRWYFRTQGDANPAPDMWRSDAAPAGAGSGPVTREERIRAHGVSFVDDRVPRTSFAVPHVGMVAQLNAHPQVRTALLIIPFVLAAAWLLSVIWWPVVRAEEGAS